MSDLKNPELHDSSLVWNLLDSTDSRYADDEFAAKLRSSSANALNHTVASTDDAMGTLRSIAAWKKFYERQPDVFIGRTAACALKAQAEGKTAMFMGFQGIEGLNGDLNLLALYHELGVRFVQPTYQRRNLAGDGCGEPTARTVGLSRWGRDLVRECNALGIVLDISHVGWRTSLDIIETSTQPVIASHSAAGGLVDCIRNKSDDELRALADGGGVIGIAGKSMFLNKGWATEGSTLEDYARHVHYVAELVGIEHVGIGTDVSDSRRYSQELLRGFRTKYPELPLGGPDDNPEVVNTEALKSPADLGNITAALLRSGLADDQVKAVIGGNAQRVAETVFPA